MSKQPDPNSLPPWPKRRHHNKTGRTQIKTGGLAARNKRIADSLGVPFALGKGGKPTK